MINSRQNIEILIVHIMSYLTIGGCYGNTFDEGKAIIESEILRIKKNKLDRKKANKILKHAKKIAAKLLWQVQGRDGYEVFAALASLFQTLIDRGFEIFQEDNPTFLILQGLVEKANETDIIDSNAKLEKAKVIAENWLSDLNREGYFV